MPFLFWTGRILFSGVFILSALNHFTELEAMAQYAGSRGVPFPRVFTLGGGLLILAGGISILFWWLIDIGVWLLIGFLVPAALIMHDFWAIRDPQAKQTEMSHFLKNFALAGAALLFFVLRRSPGLAG